MTAADRTTAVRVVSGALRRLDRVTTIDQAFRFAVAAEGVDDTVWPVIDEAMRAATGFDREALAASQLLEQQRTILRATADHLADEIARDQRWQAGAL